MQTTTLTQLLWILIFSFPVIGYLFTSIPTHSPSGIETIHSVRFTLLNRDVERTVFVCVCECCMHLEHQCLSVSGAGIGVFLEGNESIVRMLLGALRGLLRHFKSAALWKSLSHKPLVTWKWKQISHLIHSSVDSCCSFFALSILLHVLIYHVPYHFLSLTDSLLFNTLYLGVSAYDCVYGKTQYGKYVKYYSRDPWRAS